MYLLDRGWNRARESPCFLSLSLSFSPSGSLLTCNGKKARPHCIVKLAHRKQSSHSSRSEAQGWWRRKTRGGMGRVGEREQAGTANARLTEAVSLRFIAALDHERRKTSQGRPVLRPSLLPVRSSALRRTAAYSPPLLEWAFIIEQDRVAACQGAHLILHRAL